MAPVLLGLVTFGLSVSMGSAMAPATDSVTSAVPEAKAGVGSAMSDVTRQVGGALGVAVIGSIIGTAYAREMSEAPDAAQESVGAAHAVAGQVGGATGRELADTAGRAFTEALGLGLAAAAVVALAGAAGRTAAPGRPPLRNDPGGWRASSGRDDPGCGLVIETVRRRSGDGRIRGTGRTPALGSSSWAST